MSNRNGDVDARADGDCDDGLLAELVDDFLRRHRAGDRPSVDEYSRKHPGLADQIHEVFPAMIAIEQPGLAPLAAASAVERVGALVGRYKLLERIGEGGFGVVYMAEQQYPVRRVVAVKVIKPGLDTGQVVARFEAERQALALMDHPNIARVLDAGATDAGRPFFVMELVGGVPVTDYCDANSLSTRERLRLFMQVCNAVQHAHTKGVIHRDIKPTNVLVTLVDGVAVPKVIDFGVAKATQARLTDRTFFTESRQMVGTPAYMSPEQAEMGGLDVDTRSDVYSLGVLLYELLTGTTPFDPRELRSKAHGEVQRIIREVDPPRPSTRLGRLGEALTTVAARRRTDPSKLGRIVKGELDWVVMRCLEKDRARRYGTADGLARDIGRFLRDEPVDASPPVAGYRLRKLIRRNRGRVAAAGLLLAALLAGMAGTTWGLIRAQSARREAQTRLAQVEKGNEILLSVFRDVDPTSAENAGVTLRDLMCRRLGDAARKLEGDLVGDPLVVARLQHLLGTSLRKLGETGQAEVVLVRAWRTRERLLGADHVDTAAAKHELALLYKDQGKYALAEALHKEVLATRTATLGADDPETLAVQHDLAVLYHSEGKYPQAEVLLKEVLAARTARLGPDDPATLTTQHRLALAYKSQLKFESAEALYKEVLAARTARLGADHLDTVATKDMLGVVYHARGKHALAEALHKEALAVQTDRLGADHTDTVTTRHHLAEAYHAQEKFELAEVNYKEVLANRIATLPADHPYTLACREDLATLYRDRRQYDLAEAQYKQVLAASTARRGADHPATLYCRHKLGVLYRSMNRLDEAIGLMEETVRRAKATEHPAALGMESVLADTYCDAGRFADAVPLLEDVHRRATATDFDLAAIDNALLTAYVKTGKSAEAVALAREEAQAARRQFPPGSAELAAALAPAGQALMEVGAHVDAEPLLLDNYRGLKYAADEAPSQDQQVLLRDAAARLVHLYEAWGKADEAAKWRKEFDAPAPADRELPKE
jgi:serine/threonine protein kinase/tetratricopeptide (TPR) repeat protein